jgi:hypothetical protein
VAPVRGGPGGAGRPAEASRGPPAREPARMALAALDARRRRRRRAAAARVVHLLGGGPGAAAGAPPAGRERTRGTKGRGSAKGDGPNGARAWCTHRSSGFGGGAAAALSSRCAGGDRTAREWARLKRPLAAPGPTFAPPGRAFRGGSSRAGRTASQHPSTRVAPFNTPGPAGCARVRLRRRRRRSRRRRARRRARLLRGGGRGAGGAR